MTNAQFSSTYEKATSFLGYQHQNGQYQQCVFFFRRKFAQECQRARVGCVGFGGIGNGGSNGAPQGHREMGLCRVAADSK